MIYVLYHATRKIYLESILVVFFDQEYGFFNLSLSNYSNTPITEHRLIRQLVIQAYRSQIGL